MIEKLPQTYSFTDTILQKYVSKLYGLKDRLFQLDEADLKHIAIHELGFTTEDLEKIEEEFETLFKKGNSFLKVQNKQQALINFQHALDLKPFDSKCLLYVADLYKIAFLRQLRSGGWRNPARYEPLRRTALQYYERAQNVTPDNEYIARNISFLQKFVNPSPRIRRWRATISYAILFSIGAILGLLGLPDHNLLLSLAAVATTGGSIALWYASAISPYSEILDMRHTSWELDWYKLRRIMGK